MEGAFFLHVGFSFEVGLASLGTFAQLPIKEAPVQLSPLLEGLADVLARGFLA
jgi:hypothetical protein